MASLVTSFLEDLERERKALNEVSGSQLQSLTIKASLRNLVESYFDSIRPALALTTIEEDRLLNIDTSMQELLNLCHKKGSTQKYKNLLRDLKKDFVYVDGHLISLTSRNVASTQNHVDPRLLSTLKELLPSAALSYEQALIDLEQPSRLSWRGPATDLREALREILDYLAPDDDVKAMPGYKQEADAHGPTMKQKVKFIMHKRGASKASAAPAEHATDSIDLAIGTFVRSVYTRSSVSTHTPTDKAEVLRVLDLVRVVLCELLEVR